MNTRLQVYADVRKHFPPSKQMLPSSVNSALTAWWLALVFTLVGFAAFWPMLVRGLAGMVGLDVFLDKNTRELTGEAWYALAGFAGATILFGLFFTIGVRMKSKITLNLFRISFVLGLLFGLAVDGGMIYVLTGDSGGPKVPPARPVAGAAAPGSAKADAAPPLGPAPILGGALLAVAALAPIFFGVLGLTQAGSKGIREYFETTDSVALEDLLRAPEPQPEEAPMEEEYAEAGAEREAAVETLAREVSPVSPAKARALVEPDASAQEAAAALDAVLAEEGLELDGRRPTPPEPEVAAALDAVLAEEGVTLAKEADAVQAEAVEAEAVEAETVEAEAVEAEEVPQTPARDPDDPKRTMLAPKDAMDAIEEALLAEEEAEPKKNEKDRKEKRRE